MDTHLCIHICLCGQAVDGEGELAKFATSLPQAETVNFGEWRISAAYSGLIICGKNTCKSYFVSRVFS
jgi:hypothetical protein